VDGSTYSSWASSSSPRTLPRSFERCVPANIRGFIPARRSSPLAPATSSRRCARMRAAATTISRTTPATCCCAAVLRSVVRRALEDVTTRYLQAGDIHVDLAARSVDVAGTVVRLSRLEFELLVKFAGDPLRVFSRNDLARCIWRGQISGRTVDSHIARLRTRLISAGAGEVLVNSWGQGWSLTREH
jgi:DNA-binding winged helix-turn-helix (wHTH) protein